MSNRLENETSPYLLQHKENPVDWYPWCEEAFLKAKEEDKPIFLSIGYSTCHWCHVMAHESFEDASTAEILNKHFVSIKVDREERPDIDSVYMAACQAFTGSGGWPMTIFMSWDKKPFFAGSYFPKKPQYGMPSFSDLLNEILDIWQNDREKLLQYAKEVTEHLKNKKISGNAADDDLAQIAAGNFIKIFDSENGGFGYAPKFPTPHNLLFLMLYSKRSKELIKMVEKTLLQMRKGGIFDQIGYGFSRYSTDKYFLAPHFEKMLYDNALLIMAYSAAYELTKNKLYLDTAEKTAEYIFRAMTSEEGGFYSAQDADSEGVEGKYYTFKLSEITKVLGEERGKEFAKVFDITEKGNFEGVNIPNLLKSGDMKTDFQKEIKKLYIYRKERGKLHLDNKILISWNALMISALAMLYRASEKEEYLEAAKRTEEFIKQNLSEKEKLFTSFREGKRSENAFLDDYAFYISALIELYNSTLDKEYIERAEAFCDEAVKLFSDSENGGFYLCKSDNTELFMNPKETYDGAIPSGNSAMAYNFARLCQLTGDNKYKELYQKQMLYMSAEVKDYPAGHSLFLIAKLIYENEPQKITVSVKDTADIPLIKKPFLANMSVAYKNSQYPLLNDKTTYYVCKNNTCLPPTNNL